MFQNYVCIIGNITRKPELKKSGDGISILSLNIAINSVWFDKQTNEKKESVEFISVTVFGKTAENCAIYLDKGQKVFVEGKIKNRVEETEAGKRYHTGIIASRVQFGPKPQGQGTAPATKVENTTTDSSETQEQFTYPDTEINPDDVPF